MSVAFVIGFHLCPVVFGAIEGCIHLGFEKFLEDVFEAIPEKGVDNRHAGKVVF